MIYILPIFLKRFDVVYDTESYIKQTIKNYEIEKTIKRRDLQEVS